MPAARYAAPAGMLIAPGAILNAALTFSLLHNQDLLIQDLLIQIAIGQLKDPRTPGPQLSELLFYLPTRYLVFHFTYSHFL